MVEVKLRARERERERRKAGGKVGRLGQSLSQITQTESSSGRQTAEPEIDRQQPRHACDGTRISSSRHRNESACSRWEERLGCSQPQRLRDAYRLVVDRKRLAGAAGRFASCHWKMEVYKRRMDCARTEEGTMSCRNGVWTLRQPADAPGPCHPSRVQIPRPNKK